MTYHHELVPASLSPQLAMLKATIRDLKHPWLRRANPMWLTSLALPTDRLNGYTKARWDLYDLPGIMYWLLRLLIENNTGVAFAREQIEELCSALVREWCFATERDGVCHRCLSRGGGADGPWTNVWMTTPRAHVHLALGGLMSVKVAQKLLTQGRGFSLHVVNLIDLHPSRTVLIPFNGLDVIRATPPDVVNLFDRFPIIREDVEHIPVDAALERTRTYWDRLQTYVRKFLAWMAQRGVLTAALHAALLTAGPLHRLFGDAVVPSTLTSRVESFHAKLLGRVLAVPTEAEAAAVDPMDVARVLYTDDVEGFSPAVPPPRERSQDDAEPRAKKQKVVRFDLVPTVIVF
jgi:hypothetical protein